MPAETDSKASSLVLDMRKPAAEFVATFLLTYIGSWAVVYGDLSLISTNGIAVAHALTLTLVIFWAGPISGGHVNPAVTTALLLTCNIGFFEALSYYLAQFGGAIFAAMMIRGAFTPELEAFVSLRSEVGVPAPGSPFYEFPVLYGEVIGTFLLMWAVMALGVDSSRKKTKDVVAPGVGFTLYLVIMTVGEISGGGLNPARSLGPALVARRFTTVQRDHLIGPLIGAVGAAFSYVVLFLLFSAKEEGVKVDVKQIEMQTDVRKQLQAS